MSSKTKKEFSWEITNPVYIQRFLKRHIGDRAIVFSNGEPRPYTLEGNIGQDKWNRRHWNVKVPNHTFSRCYFTIKDIDNITADRDWIGINLADAA